MGWNLYVIVLKFALVIHPGKWTFYRGNKNEMYMVNPSKGKLLV